ncbi:helicase HerA-like domain-containing protein [Kitasatospora mediocidica]|uniref:helicase HerA-like domain-containing protein n=1 Tax=Kitasatospora mediocidica TaxID=58352 RepID=UPI00055CFA01|nr:helicase HerA-like domain-containing protein [Kitasatospora mediocidica]
MPEQPNPSTVPAPVQEIATGYAFNGPALDLGAAIQDGTAYPAAQVRIPLGALNRHGLVAGATGTGKTKTLQLIAEQLSAQGVPVFLADVKGDVSGISAPGEPSERTAARAAEVGQQWTPQGCPVEFYSLGGQGAGIPIRATVTSFGPLLLAKVLDLNETQEASLGLVFLYADKHGLELYDLKDLSAVISLLTSPQGKEELKGIGGLSAATAGVILRSLALLAAEGAEAFFGEPEFDTAELLRVREDGRGVVSVLELPAVQDRPRLFSTFLMWLLADLYQGLPEVGDPEKPKLVFFFDEAHLLFKGASKAFLEAITQTVRLIRSKAVGIFFVTQTPKDVPADVLAQLGNRVQHALRAFTPDDAKALKATVSTFPRSGYDLAQVLTQLGTGEAVVTVLSEKGAPTPVAVTRLRAPQSLMGPVAPDVLAAAVDASPLNARYRDAVDRESAYEKLAAGSAGAVEQPKEKEQGQPKEKEKEKEHPEAGGLLGSLLANPTLKSFARSAGTQLGREISRNLFGTAKRRR